MPRAPCPTSPRPFERTALLSRLEPLDRALGLDPREPVPLTCSGLMCGSKERSLPPDRDQGRRRAAGETAVVAWNDARRLLSGKRARADPVRVHAARLFFPRFPRVVFVFARESDRSCPFFFSFFPSTSRSRECACRKAINAVRCVPLGSSLLSKSFAAYKRWEYLFTFLPPKPRAITAKQVNYVWRRQIEPPTVR